MVLKTRSPRVNPENRASESRPEIKERLLIAAREVLAVRGLTGFKVVDVANAARANVAMINYHFGGRDGLLDEVIRQEGNAMAEARDRGLKALLQVHPDSIPDAEVVLRCWLDPMVNSVKNAESQGLMHAMVHTVFAADVSDQRKQAMLGTVMESTQRYLDVLEKCLPSVDRTALNWRMMSAIGACYLVLTQAAPRSWSQIVSGKGSPASIKVAQEELVGFIVRGIVSTIAPKRGD